MKRRPGYAIDRCVQEPNNLNHLLCGSEGTLAVITSAELRIVPLPKQKGLALIFFASVGEAMQATVELLDAGSAVPFIARYRRSAPGSSTKWPLPPFATA